ncbi:PQQ-binding-like beta-propeller repeat protein [Halorubrum lacusprofundi]|jgi:outer membrane protein assembly factor BamB|uniref:Tup1 like transcriptional repressor n=1 Tax=Halorubrum lacusprofundi (strain ATCC 49239 / DSM 5036 / JCM 8891 / ACAM 34) TaxID=416348 RepID=B9LWY7_HALLT|nr:PQQ-binding-like beta-propeller repeat protein [Halorubrum lacusprofundi]ACM58978.1 Tup1 like transcriptional repressor [Halorubrum lacusprofundi ATCC 49239]MCG1007610.1 PQQ-binding-like beta-propeller repeat protein [Halorubrum lacusprofundi]
MSDAVDDPHPNPNRDGFDARTVALGDVQPGRSRHAGRRSAVAVVGDLAVAGTADGALVAFDRDTLVERWRTAPAGVDADAPPSVVSIATYQGGILAGERSARGGVRCLDPTDGTVRFRMETRDDVGGPQRETRFFLPFVVDIVGDGERAYVAARRYERDGDDRSFHSVVFALDAHGARAWTYETDASVIALDARDDRLGVAHNRCPGDDQHGLVVLDAESGRRRFDWDPGTEGQRRIGDVALVADGAVVASHGDKRGYRLTDGGGVRWRVDLATPTVVDDETLYAYPNHVHAADDGVVFVTGNTYPEDGRETDGRHPDEHTAVGVSPDGDRRWHADVGGFASELAAAGDRVVVPGAQHFRDRDADDHGLRVLDVADGPVGDRATDGIVTAVATADGDVAAIEEPVVYHDEGIERGAYRLHWVRVG